MSCETIMHNIGIYDSQNLMNFICVLCLCKYKENSFVYQSCYSLKCLDDLCTSAGSCKFLTYLKIICEYPKKNIKICMIRDLMFSNITFWIKIVLVLILVLNAYLKYFSDKFHTRKLHKNGKFSRS